MAAHEIISVTDDVIYERTGYYGKEIMKMIQNAFSYTSIEQGRLDWNSYKKMNELIKELIAKEIAKEV